MYVSKLNMILYGLSASGMSANESPRAPDPRNPMAFRIKAKASQARLCGLDRSCKPRQKYDPSAKNQILYHVACPATKLSRRVRVPGQEGYIIAI